MDIRGKRTGRRNNIIDKEGKKTETKNKKEGKILVKKTKP